MKYTLTLILTLFCFTLHGEESTIPVIDMEDYYNEETRESFREKLVEAFRTVGFVAIINTGVDQEVIDRAYQGLEEFYSLDTETKMKYAHPEINYQRGYIPISQEVAKNRNVGDFKEFYMVGPNHPKTLQFGENVWPEEMELEEPLYSLYEELIKYSRPLLTAIAESIEQPQSFITDMTRYGDVLLRAIHYPPPKRNVEEGAVWAAAHTDINLITILPRATASGLEVLNQEGNWIRVKIAEDTFIINSGDQLANLTNGYFKSSFHRVVATPENSEGDRYSCVMFVHPRNEDDLTPLESCIAKTGGVAKYPKATRLELLSERLTDINQSSPELLEILASSGLVERMIDLGCASPDVMRILAENNLASPKILEQLE